MQNETKYNIIVNDAQLYIIKNALINEKNIDDEKIILIDIINEIFTNRKNDATKIIHDFTM